MDSYLWLGVVIGACLGLFHGTSLYREISTRARASGTPSGSLRGIYYALWALVLWTVFGAYVLTFWLLGIVAYPIVELVRRSKAA